MENAKTRRNKIEEKSPVLFGFLRKGHSIRDSCQAADITRETVYKWLKKAEEVDAPDEYIQFYFDFHDARAKGQAKLLADIDRWENETETTVVETIEFVRDKDGNLVTDDDGEPVEKLLERKTTTKKKRSRASAFDRAKFKLQSQYPDRWGNNTTSEDDPNEKSTDAEDSQDNPFRKPVVGKS